MITIPKLIEPAETEEFLCSAVIEIQTNNYYDVEAFVALIRKMLRHGARQGSGTSDNGSFSFTVTEPQD